MGQEAKKQTGRLSFTAIAMSAHVLWCRASECAMREWGEIPPSTGFSSSQGFPDAFLIALDPGSMKPGAGGGKV